jgi:hypothetical protein
MPTTTAPRQLESVVLRRETADAPGVLRLNGAYYDFTSAVNGYHVERLATGSVYFVKVAGGRTQGCNCPAAKFARHRGPCKHEHGVEAVLAAW